MEWREMRRTYVRSIERNAVSVGYCIAATLSVGTRRYSRVRRKSTRDFIEGEVATIFATPVDK
jgi:hypothetical protein